MIKWLDMPPVWLAVMIALAHVQVTRFSVFVTGAGLADLIGGLLLGAGLVLIALAVIEMRKARTTVIPHRDPDALVTAGIFRRSRNPIYLGDTLILGGLIFRWEAWPALVLIPLFMWLITDRFILPEEARLRDRFAAGFDRYAETTRRWL